MDDFFYELFWQFCFTNSYTNFFDKFYDNFVEFLMFLPSGFTAISSVFQNSWNFTTNITLEYTVQTGKRSHKAIKWRLFLYSFFPLYVLHTIVELQHMFYKPTVWIIHFPSISYYFHIPKIFLNFFPHTGKNRNRRKSNLLP